MRFAILFTLCLLGVASAHSMNKRFSTDFIKEQAEKLKEDLNKFRLSLFNHFHPKPAAVESVVAAAPVEAEVSAVEKRDIHEVLGKLSKFAHTKAQQARDKLRKILDAIFKEHVAVDDEDTTEHPLAKRSLFDALEQMNTKAQASAKKVFDGLQKTISSIFAPFKRPAAAKPVEDSTEKPVAKRSILEKLERMNEKVQAQAQKAFHQLRKIFDEMFKKYPDAHRIEVEVQDGEVVTERVSKRNIFDFFGRLNEKLQDEAAKVFGHLGSKFDHILKHDDDEELDLDFDEDFEEDSTELSIEKRDLFNWFRNVDQRIQDQTHRWYSQIQHHNPFARPLIPGMIHKPHWPHMPNPFAPKPAPPKPQEPEEEVEEIEVVTSA